ncbi:hypothetical protein B0O99DRAFT_285062 [Bisporella sp. PMI_857]|nr:hypothetical protein B0O99DRAFT_285062 [Bisporella sp. PMI_857]
MEVPGLQSQGAKYWCPEALYLLNFLVMNPDVAKIVAQQGRILEGVVDKLCENNLIKKMAESVPKRKLETATAINDITWMVIFVRRVLLFPYYIANITIFDKYPLLLKNLEQWQAGHVGSVLAAEALRLQHTIERPEDYTIRNVREGTERSLMCGYKKCGYKIFMEKCARCMVQRYCSTEHQKKDWKYHKHYCDIGLVDIMESDDSGDSDSSEDSESFDDYTSDGDTAEEEEENSASTPPVVEKSKENPANAEDKKNKSAQAGAPNQKLFDEINKCKMALHQIHKKTVPRNEPEWSRSLDKFRACLTRHTVSGGDDGRPYEEFGFEFEFPETTTSRKLEESDMIEGATEGNSAFKKTVDALLAICNVARETGMNVERSLKNCEAAEESHGFAPDIEKEPDKSKSSEASQTPGAKNRCV